MFPEEHLKPGASGPTIHDLTVARPRTALNYASVWSADALTRLCEAHGIHTGSINDKESLLAMLEKSLTQPVVYDGFELQDLTNFVEVRGLDPYQSTINAITTNSSSPEVSHLQRSEWKEKTTPGDIGYQSTKRNLKSTRPTVKPLRETHSINTSTDLDTVFGRLKTTLSGSKTESRLEDQLAVVAPNPPSEPDRSKSPLIELLETADQNACFNFLGLPAEIRQQVYHLTCCASLTVLHPEQQPAITKACRLIREEALPIYYRYNRFAVVVDAERSMTQHNSWMRCIQSKNLSLIRSFAFWVIPHNKLIELDIKPYGETRYDFKTKKLPSENITLLPSLNTRLHGLRRIRCGLGGLLSRSRLAMGKVENDGLALVLGMAGLPTNGYIELDFQLADLIQLTISEEIVEAGERRARFGDGEYKGPPDRSAFFPIWLSSKDWELLQKEWETAQGFSVMGLRALIYAFRSRSFWQNFRE